MFIPRSIYATVILLTAMYSAVTPATDLKIVIDDIRGDKGAVRVALFNDPTGFKTDVRFAGAFMAARTGRVVVAFPDLARGTYAVSAFHDENGNGDLDTNFLGIPSEGYGFSNAAKGFAGPPSFDAAAVVLEDKHLTVTLKLTY